MQNYLVCLSGPEESRARAELALEEARVPLLPRNHHNYHWGAKVPTPAGHSVLVVEHPDVDHVVNALDARSKWVLRTHHHAHPAPERAYDPLAELAHRIAALEAQSPLPPIRGGAVESPAAFNQSGSYSAEQTRRAIFAAYARTAANSPGIITGGLLSAADCQLTAPASGMSVNVSTGELIIPGNEGASQGGYYGRVSSQTNLSIAAANPSNPRIDLVCGTISDSGYTEPAGGSGNQWAAQVVTGTPTSGATLSNLNGVGSLPGSSLLLGYVLVPASATNIITADISNMAAVVALQAGQREWSYAQVTSPVTVASTTESAGTTILSPAAFTPDGQPVIVEFFCPYVTVSNAAIGSVLQVSLFEGATQISRLAVAFAQGTASANQNMASLVGRYRFTPAAAAHTYTVTAYTSSTTGTPAVGAGAGGTGNHPPAFVRFTKV